jgi:hypothetical protein
MAEHGAYQGADEREGAETLGAELRRVGRRSGLLSADELHFCQIPTQRFGGYDQAAVDVLLGRAAQTIDSLTQTKKELASDPVPAGAAASVQLLEEAVSQMLVTTQRLIDEEKDLAHRAAAALVAEAQLETMQAERLRLAAQTELDAARKEAAGILAAARSERERLLATWTRDADKARAAAEEERQQIDASITRRREEWRSRLTEALARLDAAEHAGTSGNGGGRLDAPRASEFGPIDLAADLGERVGGVRRPAHPGASS